MNGQYPAGVIDWGTNTWGTSNPWGQFTTVNLSYLNSNVSSGTFNFINKEKLFSIKAYNGGTVTSTVVIAGAPNPTMTFTVPIQTTQTLTTNWTEPSNAVTISSSNGWNTNFDDMIYGHSYTATPTIAWDPVPEPIVGYRIYYMPSTAWTKLIDLPCWTIDGVVYCQTQAAVQKYLDTSIEFKDIPFCVRAYNDKGEESTDCSNSVTICLPHIWVPPEPYN